VLWLVEDLISVCFIAVLEEPAGLRWREDGAEGWGTWGSLGRIPDAFQSSQGGQRSQDGSFNLHLFSPSSLIPSSLSLSHNCLQKLK
jgi:hypothetical protein